LTDEVYGVLGVERAVAAFVSYGSTAPAEVDKQVSRWREKIAKEGGIGATAN
jgi:argininosuccinate lyase